jgi:hypothetical protein
MAIRHYVYLLIDKRTGDVLEVYEERTHALHAAQNGRARQDFKVQEIELLRDYRRAL